MTSPQVEFGDISWQTVDTTGTQWVCEDLTGWADLPETSATISPRALDHGAFYGDAYYSARLLVLDGVIKAPDQLALQAALHRLKAQHWRTLRLDARLTVVEVDGTRWLAIRAAKAGVEVRYLSPSSARVVLEMVAAWPIKAGELREVNARASTPGVGRTYPRGGTYPFRTYGESGSTGDMHPENRGNAPARPVILFFGPMVNPQIIAPDQGFRLRFNITLALGDVLVVDADTHSVLLNEVGNRRYVLTNDSAWFDILPGVNNLQFRSEDNRDGLCVVRFNDGWW